MTPETNAQALRFEPENDHAADVWLVGAIVVLLTYGSIMVYSATVASGDQTLETSFTAIKQHLMHVAMGVAVMLLVRVLPVAWWDRLSKQMLLLGVLGLIVVLLPGLGVNVNGSTRWLELGAVRVQPAEFAKLLMVIYVAGFLTRKRESLDRFNQGILMVGIVLVLMSGLLLLQPDFGSVVVLTFTVTTMLFLGGVRLWHLLLCALAGGLVLTSLVWLEPYRLQRITSFLDPWLDPFDTGFQLVQALIAFGRGEWMGVGLGASIQKLYYLPHPANDFLLAVVAEELGLIGVSAVVALFALVFWRAFDIARRAQRIGMLHGARLAEGVGLLVAFQAAINMGVNMGVLPTKGLNLPLMSYGGSSMLATCAGLGLLLAVDRATRPQSEATQ